MPSTLKSEPITIRVVDGRNGHPITDETLQLWFDRVDGDAMSISTDKKGIAQVKAPPGAAIVISANLYIDCRYSAKTGPQRPIYSVSEIIRTGILAANTCGKMKLSATPGELIFFVRPEHWWEGFSR